MASRREFIQAGIAASVFPVVVAGGPASRLMPPSTPFYKVLFDGRFVGGRAFSRRARELGAAVHEIEGDITSLWYSDLAARIRVSPVAMAGVTLNGALFCLDALARDYGMRVVFRAEHDSAEPTLRGDEQAWGSEAAVIASLVAERSRQVRLPALSVPHYGRPDGRTEALVSWVIVPAGARMVS